MTFLSKGIRSNAFGLETGKERTIRKEFLAWEENLAPTIWCGVEGKGERWQVQALGETEALLASGWRESVSGFSC